MPHKDPKQRRAWQRAYSARNRTRINEAKRRWRAPNREKRNTESRKQYRENLEYARLYFRARKYKMSVEQLKALYTAQNGLCAICGHSSARLCIDHDHATGKVRGLLCDRCNGHVVVVLERDAHLLDKARAYLELHRSPA